MARDYTILYKFGDYGLRYDIVQLITGNNSYSALLIRMESFLLSSVPLLTLDRKVLVYDP